MAWTCSRLRGYLGVTVNLPAAVKQHRLRRRATTGSASYISSTGASCYHNNNNNSKPSSRTRQLGAGRRSVRVPKKTVFRHVVQVQVTPGKNASKMRLTYHLSSLEASESITQEDRFTSSSSPSFSFLFALAFAMLVQKDVVASFWSGVRVAASSKPVFCFCYILIIRAFFIHRFLFLFFG